MGADLDFFKEWLDDVRSASGRQLFAAGELWRGNIDKLHNYIVKPGGKMSLFDAPLHYNFHAASKAGVVNIEWQSGGNHKFTTPRSGTGNASASF